MTDEIALHEEPPAPVRTSTGPLLGAIMELARSPDIRIEVLTLLLDRQAQAEADQARREYNDAMNAAQAEIQPVVKTVENKHTNSTYAKLEHVDAAIRPIYLKHGFSLSFNVAEPLTAGNIRMSCRCAHKGGHSELFYREAPPDTLGPQGKATKTALHGAASTETFLRRYLTAGIFNVVFRNQDDDGVRGGMRLISQLQAEEIRMLIHEAGQDEEAFLQRLTAGTVHAAEELEAGQGYTFAKSTLEAMIRRRQKQGEAA